MEGLAREATDSFLHGPRVLQQSQRLAKAYKFSSLDWLVGRSDKTVQYRYLYR